MDRLAVIKGKIYGEDVAWLIEQVEELRSDLSTARAGYGVIGAAGLVAGFLLGVLICR